MNKRSVVILGSGYVGNNLFKTLNQNKNFSTYLFAKSDFDYTNYRQLTVFCEQTTPDFIINCCGYTGRPNVDACESDKENTYKLNVTFPTMLAKVCETYDINLYHISSGCIYTGYEKDYNENDLPNFGVFSNESSFYSKTKHAAELSLNVFDNVKTFRIRMPFCGLKTQRNYLEKIKKYDNLLNAKNSKTDIPEFCRIIETLMDRDNMEPKSYTLNVCNPDPLTTSEIVEIYKKHNYNNPKWKFISYENLPIKANRSNCILSTDKLASEFGITMRTEAQAIDESIFSLSKQ